MVSTSLLFCMSCLSYHHGQDHGQGHGHGQILSPPPPPLGGGEVAEISSGSNSSSPAVARCVHVSAQGAVTATK